MPSSLLREYETIIVIRPDATEEVMSSVRERVEGIISSRTGHLLTWDEWGRRRLAHPVRDRSAQKNHTKANYHYLRYLGGSDLVPELQRNLRLLEPVLKFLTIRLEDDVDPEVRMNQGAPASESAEA